MNKIDPKTAQRVWQRVQGKPEPAQETQALTELLRQLQEDQACCLQLTRQLPERYRVRLKRMVQQEQSHTDCLKGICHLLTGQKPVLPPFSPEAEPAEISLRRYYGRKLRCLNQYEKWVTDPQFGQIFIRLAQQTRALCQELLELMGSLP